MRKREIWLSWWKKKTREAGAGVDGPRSGPCGGAGSAAAPARTRRPHSTDPTDQALMRVWTKAAAVSGAWTPTMMQQKVYEFAAAGKRIYCKCCGLNNPHPSPQPVHTDTEASSRSRRAGAPHACRVAGSEHPQLPVPPPLDLSHTEHPLCLRLTSPPTTSWENALLPRSPCEFGQADRSLSRSTNEEPQLHSYNPVFHKM